MSKFETTEGVGMKVWNAVKKNAITFGEPSEKTVEDVHTKVWKAPALENGTQISFKVVTNTSKREDGKRRNPRYLIAITDKDGKENVVSGKGARNVHKRLAGGPPRTRTTKLDENNAAFFEGALDGI